jgi:hypothetical protein
MTRGIFYLVALVICGIALPFVGPSTIPFVLVSGIMIGLVIPLLDMLSSNVRYLRLAYYTARYPRQKIRLSVSYLFRIKVGDVYLLIKGKRWNQYQPVGGVYKVSSSAKHEMNIIGALDDNLVPVDAVSENDLRIRIPVSRLITFVRWFESGYSRETSPWREFYEELIGPGILSADEFPFIFTDFIRRDIRPIRFSSHAQSLEILIADIYELLPTANQLEALKRLKETGHPEIIWATEDEIRHLGVAPGKKLDIRIGEPAVWTL